jgi:lysosomal acid lipase/cholesteryl ester hydrolase
MDEFAFHDIPDSIDYILSTTMTPSLSYIGFSQGTAQAFAALSIHPVLNDKVDLFIALAPAMSPAGLHNGVVDAMIKASPEVIFLAFGRRSILSSATMWQSILYPPIFVRLIDMSLSFLFNWTGRNIPQHQKLAAYPHLYSYTSTKSVVHWFQIIRNKSFQMYDDDVQAPLSIGVSDRYYKVAKFPTRNIKTPVVLVYGGSDSLVDIKVMLKELPKHTIAREIPHFEHLDFLWANEVKELVFPHVFHALSVYPPQTQSPRQRTTFRMRAGPNPPSYSEDEQNSSLVSDGANDSEGTPGISVNSNHNHSRSYAPAARVPPYYSPGSPTSPTATFDLSRFNARETHVSSDDYPARRVRSVNEVNQNSNIRRNNSDIVRSEGEDSTGTGHKSDSGGSMRKVVSKGGISIGKREPTVGLGG